MKKIVFIANQYPPNVMGGAELSLQTLVRELTKRGIEAVVISLSNTGTNSQDEVEGVRIYRLAVHNVYALADRKQSAIKKLLWHSLDVHNRTMATRVAGLLDHEKPDAVSTHNLQGFSVAVWTAVRMRGIHLIHTLHDYYLLCPRTTMFREGRNCSRTCLSCYVLSARKRAATKQVDVVIGVSRYVLDAHLKRGLFANARAAVIHSARARTAAEAQPAETRGQSTPLRIGYIGRVEQEKGIEVLLRAVGRIKRGDWTLHIAGNAPSPQYLEDLKRRFTDPRISYAGYVSPAGFYPSLDILVVPSIWHEALGVVVYEAMGFGIPVIASRTGGIPEMLSTGDTGWLFESGNDIELTALLENAAASPGRLSAMRSACMARRNDFLPDIQARKYLETIGWAQDSPTDS